MRNTVAIRVRSQLVIRYSLALSFAGHEDIRRISRGHADISRVYS